MLHHFLSPFRAGGLQEIQQQRRPVAGKLPRAKKAKHELTRISGVVAVEQLSDDGKSAQGWAFAGGNYSVCVGGNKRVFGETAKADYNALFKALVVRRLS